ncbi:MAG: DNA recombination protein RmuC [Candidatus Methanomethylicia archaeon]|jgi:DNA anti-recombination protein RmuC|nr:DNA recombination protein RmuC [Candidatus Methanomethylicia archaeon]
MEDFQFAVILLLSLGVFSLIMFIAMKRLVKAPPTVQLPDLTAINNAISTLNTSISGLASSFETTQKGMQDNLSSNLKNFSETVSNLSKAVADLRQALELKVEGMSQTLTADLQRRLSEVSLGLENLRKNLDENIVPKLSQLDYSQNEVKQNIQTFVALFSGSTRTKGVAGEAAIRMILKALPSSLWGEQVEIPGTSYRADFVIYVPQSTGGTLMLPIDSKFSVPSMPEKEMTAQEQKEWSEKANKMIETRASEVAKYVAPEKGTTNFALMFVPDAVYQLITQNTLKEVVARNVIPVNTPGLVASAFILARFSREVECAKDAKRIVDAMSAAVKLLDEVSESVAKAKKQIASADRNLDDASNGVSKARERLSIGSTMESES